ncbi:DUF11 domain-containing protein [Sphingomonas sp. CCH10-B3]|uniref:DUF11 domain-containing protein n=1 Tax=Sphingomonas sp. CCH10-B3 TaxID=1768757 RepID=UPI00082C705F|nr:DUF11 domain-containing protein [Sphingomonas sp. CCH10-B3]
MTKRTHPDRALCPTLNRPALRIGLAATSGLGLLSVAVPASAELTRAGVVINNTATASFDDPTGTTASANSGDVATRPAVQGEVLTFRVTNAGNGEENFRLTANGAVGGNGFTPVITRIAIDSDGDGLYDPAKDAAYVAGTNDPLIAPESSATVFVIANIPAGLNDAARAAISLQAQAVTGTGPAGTSFAGRGTGGGDAITGATTADRTASGYLRVSAANVDVVKSATVADQYGGTAAIPGATITYKLVARTTGSGSLANLRLGDAIPDGTSYIAESLDLDGVRLTDAADGDAGSFAANRVTATLGTVPGGVQRVLTFKVKIN